MLDFLHLKLASFLYNIENGERLPFSTEFEMEYVKYCIFNSIQSGVSHPSPAQISDLRHITSDSWDHEGLQLEYTRERPSIDL